MILPGLWTLVGIHHACIITGRASHRNTASPLFRPAAGAYTATVEPSGDPRCRVPERNANRRWTGNACMQYSHAMPHQARSVVLAGLLLGAPCARAGAGLQRPDVGFPVGEELAFTIKWGFIPIGSSRVKSEWVEQDGALLLSLRYRVRTNSVFNKLYPMNDLAESIVDPVTFLPRSFVFTSTRRRLRCSNRVTFHHAAGLATIADRCGGSETLVEIAPDTRDILTFMFDRRRRPLQPGSRETHRVMGHEGLLDLALAMREPATIRLSNYGAVPALVVEPEMDYEGLLIKDGKVRLWVADDARRLAVRLDIQAPLASIHTVLCSVGGPGADRWTEPRGRCADAAPVPLEAP
jgi:hypothetical protein